MAVRNVFVFRTAASPTAILDAVHRFGWDSAASSALAQTVFVPSATEEVIVFQSGTRLASSFRSTLTMTRTDDGRTVGRYRVVSWKEDAGIVGDISQMQIINDRLRTAVSSLDPNAQFSTEVDGDKVKSR